MAESLLVKALAVAAVAYGFWALGLFACWLFDTPVQVLHYTFGAGVGAGTAWEGGGEGSALLRVVPFVRLGGQENGEAELAVVCAWARNIGWVLLFALQHSIMSRALFKDLIGQLVLPQALVKPLFYAGSGLTMQLLVTRWEVLPGEPVWDLPRHSDAGCVVHWARVAAFGCLIYSNLLLGDADLTGLQAIFGRSPKRPVADLASKKQGLTIRGAYAFVRHPIMSSFLFALWLPQRMTMAHLCLSIALTVYIVAATTHFEEPSLVSQFGGPYLLYQQQVPMFFPMRSLAQLPTLTDRE